ncbi:flagellar basal body rod protein FlgC [Noviherbaspirillum pedocola]|uniref:Flagellar basal-body rod protein FlgC n=1 Tax=Noviherbaspirillum pedocola TaxID=2801341 RepID=A0A934SUA9_9BURK|nr:flagellar basal body rod protein FlgC [Noviherbaspirillum pedocola]MBK4735694.1 flagellar basal body rod protein FlgC [Noviherbaspirillum pedocola]
MDYQASFAIGAAGMAVEKMRADIASLNLANASTTRTADGRLYRAARLLTTSAPLSGFAAFMEGDTLAPLLPQAVGVTTIDTPPRLLHEPGHPHADERGFVAYPGIDSLTETVNIMTATRNYEANLLSISAARTMALKTLEIGGSR